MQWGDRVVADVGEPPGMLSGRGLQSIAMRKLQRPSKSRRAPPANERPRKLPVFTQTGTPEKVMAHQADGQSKRPTGRARDFHVFHNRSPASASMSFDFERG